MKFELGMPVRTFVLLALLAAVGWYGYQRGVVGDPCERLRERCRNVSTVEADVAAMCTIIGWKTAFGRPLTGPICFELLEELNNLRKD